MKITCQSCQSKYNVADEKVQGKVVKIRCRKCGATIVVNGAALKPANGAAETPPEASARSTDNAKPSEIADHWHVSIAENDQRTMGVAELADAYRSGVVADDTFVWTEGMGDWKPLGEMENVLAALRDRATHSSGVSEGVPTANVAVKAPPSSPGRPAHEFASSASAPYQAPMTFGPVATAGDAGARLEARRAAVKREGPARDLFATDLGESHGTQGMRGGSVETSAPLLPDTMAPIDDPNRLTGERNENSVLFSLAVLTKTVEERAPAAISVASNGREDSGLIDLKALAAKTESMRPVIMADGNIFSAPLGTMTAIGSPVGALDAPFGEAQTKSKVARVIALTAAIALLVVLGIVIGVKFAGGSNAASPAASSAPAASAEPGATASTTASARLDSPADSASVAAAVTKPKPITGGATVWHPPPPAPAAVKPVVAGAGAPVPAAATAASTPPAAKKSDCGCNGDLMCLMKCSTH